jgi:hypothetical protein
VGVNDDGVGGGDDIYFSWMCSAIWARRTISISRRQERTLKLSKNSPHPHFHSTSATDPQPCHPPQFTQPTRRAQNTDNCPPSEAIPANSTLPISRLGTESHPPRRLLPTHRTEPHRTLPSPFPQLRAHPLRSLYLCTDQANSCELHWPFILHPSGSPPIAVAHPVHRRC